MPSYWFQYWKPFQINDAVSEPWRLNHSAGDQLRKVKPGDVVWIVSVEPPGRLITLGPIHVRHVVPRKQAEHMLGPDIWPAKWHIIDDRKNVCRVKYADLSSIAAKVRFESVKFPKLILHKGRVSGTQFQAMRKLTPESANDIGQFWKAIKSRAEIEIDNTANALDDLASLDARRITLVRREQGLLRAMLFADREIGRCGICSREFPTSLLVAAHIKPRAKCNDDERRDVANNILPLCMLGCDTLFEQGYISVKAGCVIAGPKLADTPEVKSRVKALVDSQCKYWSIDSKKYFEWRMRHPLNSGISTAKL